MPLLLHCGEMTLEDFHNVLRVEARKVCVEVEDTFFALVSGGDSGEALEVYDVGNLARTSGLCRSRRLLGWCT